MSFNNDRPNLILRINFTSFSVMHPVINSTPQKYENVDFSTYYKILNEKIETTRKTEALTQLLLKNGICPKNIRETLGNNTAGN
jgi:hypothetical protein